MAENGHFSVVFFLHQGKNSYLGHVTRECVKDSIILENIYIYNYIKKDRKQMALGIDVKKQVFDIMLGMLGMRKKILSCKEFKKVILYLLLLV